ncbi:uncharacterized protein LOC123530764 [Mercenaria mercenaria]|uniref:uncharacterized protein LOC123530764 n=1 Tax=Mercenaria mercenaria TaxID=6596 RepID=UPI00234F1288|nr:uncharacterized protein LOC123530764 [Mercenaria mercenaria]XP_053374590.1 uncharacterized protein LOC123530764 [Mercenaria mercenaria]
MDQKTNVEISDLPAYIIVHIFKFIDRTDLLFSIRNTCQLWNQLSRERVLWRTLDVTDFHNYVFTPKTFLELLRDTCEAVESCHFNLIQHDLKIIKHEGTICPHLQEICIGFRNKANLNNVISTIDVNNGLLRLSEKYPDLKKLCIVNQVLLFEDIFKTLEVFVYESIDRSVGRIRAREFLQHHSCLKHITLKRCILSVAAVTKILTEYSQLITLDLLGCTCVFDELNNALNLEDLKVEKLRTLNLSETDVVDGLLQKIARKAAKLEHLNIAKCPRITNAAIEHVAKFCTNLRILIINVDVINHSEGQFDVTGAGIERIAENCHHLTVLKINNCPEVGDNGVASIVKACHQLVELEVAGCLSLQDETVLSLVKNCLRIRRLNLGNCPQLTGRSISSVLKHCKNLRYLNIESCHRVADLELIESKTHEILGDSDYEVKVEEVNCELIGKKHKVETAPEILENDNFSKLEDVKTKVADEKNGMVGAVPGTLETEDTCTDTVEKQQAESAEYISEEFECSDNELRTDENAVKPFADLSQATETKFTHDNVPSVQFLRFLEKHSHVSVLNLSFCSKVTNNCIKQIAQHCPDLRELDIQACYMVTNAGVRELIQHCKFLQTLNISGGSVSQTSRLTDDCLEDIIRYGNLKKLMIVKNYNITADGVFKVVQNCEEIQSLTVEVSRRSNISKEMLIELSGDVKDKTICLQFRGDVEILVFKDAEFKLRHQLDDSGIHNKI